LRDNPLRWLGLGAWSLRARALLEQRGPFDRVIAHWLLPAGYPILATANVADAELEIVVHGSDARMISRLPASIRRHLFGKLSRKGVRLRCVSNELSELIRRASAGSFRGPICVLPAALEIGQIASKREARAALGLTEQQRIAVIAGRLIPEKRVDCALRAAALVPDLEVFVIGDGNAVETLRRLFPKVRFLGRRSRPETLMYIAAADVVLSASRAEGSPSVVREARALGVPVVAANTGDLAQWAASDPGLFAVD
jgi:glycosyltransferase involved in cell wall biosynthesis